MPLELQIFRAAEFIRVGAHGHFDLAASQKALAKLARACRKRGINQALMDLRALRPGPKPVFTRDDLLALVTTFHEIGFTPKHRLAILFHSDPHKRARLFAFVSRLHGWTVQAFGDFEKAIHWLSTEPEIRPESGRLPAGKQVSIRVWKEAENLPSRPVPLSQGRVNEPRLRGKLALAAPRVGRG